MEKIKVKKKTFGIYRSDERKEKIKRVLERKQLDLTVVFENINDPHNLSACMRTCDSVGIYKSHLIYHSGQPEPKIERDSSAGAKKWLITENYTDVDSCFEKLHKEGFKIYSTHMSKESVSLFDLDLTEKVALVFGNEHAGVSERVHELSDGNFLVPQAGFSQSLNISVACAVSLYEAYRQRDAKKMYEKKQFEEKEFEYIYSEWLEK